MKIITFGWRVLIAFFLISALSCKKHRSTEEQPVEKPETKQPEIKKYIPVKFESGSQVITFKYLDGTTLLSEMTNTNGQKDVLSYNANQQIVKYERYQNEEQTYLIDYLKNVDGLVIKANQFIVTPHNYTSDGYLILTYNVQNQLISVKSYDNNNGLTVEKSKSYTPNGNPDKMTTTTTGSPDHVMTLTYDNKNGVFKYVYNAQLLAVTAQDNFFLSVFNNILSGTSNLSAQNNLNYSYTYNANDYPSRYTVSSGSLIKNYTITYKAL